MPKIIIMPSLLAADMGRLAEECRRAEAAGADALHVDIMDGHFVPNLSLGPDIVKMARASVKIPLDTHLMVTHPQDLTAAFIKAGANPLLIHIEAQCDVRAVLQDLRRHGIKPGLTLNPETPVEAVFPYLDDVDEVLFMSVHPGFGGQAFIPQVLPKVAALRRRAPDLDIAIDGGINRATTIPAAEHGVNMFVAGTYLFSAPDMPAEIALMRAAIHTAYGKKI